MQFPGKVHATYALAGAKRVVASADYETVMGDASPSSQPTDLDSSQPESQNQTKAVVRTTFQLVQEEELEEAKLSFEKIDMIYVYSLEPARLADDLAILADCQRIVQDLDVSGGLDVLNSFAVLKNPMAKQISASVPTASLSNVGRSETSRVSNTPVRPSVSETKAKMELKTDSESSKKSENKFGAAPTKKPSQRQISSPFQFAAKTSKPVAEPAPKPKPELAHQEVRLEPKKQTEASSIAMPVKPVQVSQELLSMFSDNESEHNSDDSDIEMADEVDDEPIEGDLVGDLAGDSTDPDGTENSIQKNVAEDEQDPVDPSQMEEDAKTESAAADTETAERKLSEHSVATTLPKPKRRRRGIRQVEERVRTMENGFMVYKTVMKPIEFSESETEGEEISVKPKDKPKAAKSVTESVVKSEASGDDKETDESESTRKKGGVKKEKTVSAGQKSLMNFWKK